MSVEVIDLEKDQVEEIILSCNSKKKVVIEDKKKQEINFLSKFVSADDCPPPMTAAQKKRMPKKIKINKNFGGIKKKKKNKKQQEGGMQKIKNLYNNIRNSYIRKVKYGYHTAFEVETPTTKKLLYSGLTTRLKSILYPELEENPFLKKSTEQRKSKYYTSKKKIKNCLAYGKEHGTLVHSQLEYFVKKKKENPNITIYDVIETVDECTLRIISLCEKKEWSFVDSEFMIYDEQSRVATAIDLLVYHKKTDKLILIELKSGYTSEVYGFHKNDSKFIAPFDNITNCPKNRHMLQLMAMREILARKYKIKVDESYILRVMPDSKNTISLIPLEEWCYSHKNRTNLKELLISSSRN